MIYNRIGKGYATHRCADPRIVKALAGQLDLSPPATIAEIGAGTGNYSRALADLGFDVWAVEPSATMRRQAVMHPSVRWIGGEAEELYLDDGSADAVACILAVHHFSSLPAAVKEMARICESGPIVWLTFDPREAEIPWPEEYWPSIWKQAYSVFPPVAEVADQLASGSSRTVAVAPLPIPHDLEDLFMAAGWRRPELYLDAGVRAGMSGFALADSDQVERGLERLRSDLESGQWEASYGDLLLEETVDWGYRFLKAR